ncbi:hypothetical protein NZ698_14350 [Chryseobacterium sp. PBS4-4]|uniref:Uncharacterized protein n=1 Tax=Chryseobacterium edaphi TaxID=2976532 RepID=A0ABT2W832_9FLAO|nr:hypothetical protein [Chryseobacterium edaphi]MCU7618378.1 hypothetical protein [Chryseobacterium edaphi]
MTSTEEKQIDDYLILNKLPLDILLEVRDHMISQVSDLQINKKLSFEEAFFKTKILWEPEFKMTKYFLFYTGEVSVLEKKIVKAKYNSIFRKSFLIASLIFVINLFAIYISKTQEFYGILFKIQNGLVFFAPIALWIFHYKKRKFFRIDYKYKGKLFYTMYQQNNTLLIACLSSMGQIVMHKGGSAFQFFKTDLPVDTVSLLLTLLIPFVAHIILIFGMINLFEHNKTLDRINSFIKISEAN